MLFTVDNEDYPLLKVHDFTLCAHKSYLSILQIDSLEGYQIIFVRSSSLAKGQQTLKLNQSIYSRDHPER